MPYTCKLASVKFPKSTTESEGVVYKKYHAYGEGMILPELFRFSYVKFIKQDADCCSVIHDPRVPFIHSQMCMTCPKRTLAGSVI